MEDSVELGASAPEITTEDKEHSKFLNDIQRHGTERLKQKWKRFFNECQELESAIRPYDEKKLMKKVMTKKETRAMETLQAELRVAIKKKESIQKELRNR